jgi:hypothetical protein
MQRLEVSGAVRHIYDIRRQRVANMMRKFILFKKLSFAEWQHLFGPRSIVSK